MGIIRILLALSVFFHHYPGQPFHLISGGIAVEAFFIISGFYIALVITEKYSKAGDSWISSFYLSRILRLFPAYLLLCALKVAYDLWRDNPDPFTSNNDLTLQAQVALIFLNTFIIGHDSWLTLSPYLTGFFGESALKSNYLVVGQAWSLSVELIFYAAAPFLVLSKKRVLIIFALSFLIGVYFSSFSGLPHEPWRSRLFISNFSLFFIGVMGYWIYRSVATVDYAKSVGKWLLVAAALLTALSVVLTGGVFLFSGAENYDLPHLWLFYILFAAGIPFIFIYTKNSKLDNAIGELSYPLYLFHGGVLRIVTSRLTDMPVWLAMTITLACTLLLCFLIYWFLDRPMDKIRHRLASSTANGARLSGRAS